MMTAQLPEGYSVRPATIGDADAATDLFNACEIEEAGEPDYSPGEVGDEWANLEISERVALVETSSGLFVGGLVMRSRGNVVHDADIYVHPKHTDRGIGGYLVLLSEARAESWIDIAPRGVRVVIRNPVHSHNKAANDLLQSHGYVPIRNFVRMEIDLGREPELPKLPDGLEMRSCRPGDDEPAIYGTIQEAFQDHWSFGPSPFEEWMDRRVFDPSLSFLITEGDEVAATVVCRIFGDEFGWIGELGVRNQWRRRGLGSALLTRSFIEFYRRGIKRVALGVDTQNANRATQLYERLGMQVTRSFVIYEKELRPGKPWEG